MVRLTVERLSAYIADSNQKWAPDNRTGIIARECELETYKKHGLAERASKIRQPTKRRLKIRLFFFVVGLKTRELEKFSFKKKIVYRIAHFLDIQDRQLAANKTRSFVLLSVTL